MSSTVRTIEMVQEEIKCCADDVKWFGVRMASWPGRYEAAQEELTRLWVELNDLQRGQ